MKDFYVPRLYISGFIRDFDSKAKKYGLHRKRYAKGETLTDRGTINNHAHYICSGLVHLSLIHSSGNMKSIMFFGPGAVFPIGVVPHENVIDYEMIMLAMTDTETYKFSYPSLRQMCVDDGEFSAQILEENCRLIGYLFYQEMNNAFSPAMIRVCDILYLMLSNMDTDGNTINIRQEDLSSLVGISSAQLERVLKDLRERRIITTSRGKIHIPDAERLRAQCSTELREEMINPPTQGQRDKLILTSRDNSHQQG